MTAAWTGPRPRQRGSQIVALPADVAAALRRLRAEVERLQAAAMRSAEHYAAKDALDAYIAALLRRGWPMRAVGDVLGLDRRTIHYRLRQDGRRRRERDLPEPTDLPLPLAPPPVSGRQ